MAKNPYGSDAVRPIRYAVDVGTGSDSVDLLQECSGIIVGVSGDVSVQQIHPETGAEEAVVYPALAAGVVHPISALRINATNTTATGIRACFN